MFFVLLSVLWSVAVSVLLVAGFLNSRLKFVLPLVVTGQLFYYLSQSN